MKINKGIIITIAVVLLIVLCVIIMYFFSEGEGYRKASSDQKNPSVQFVAEVREQPLFYETMGVVEPKHITEISSELNGLTEKIFVSIGEEVKEGDILLEMNSEVINSKFKQAVSNHEKAQETFALLKKQYERTKRLYDKEAASLTELENIETRYQHAMSEEQRTREFVNELNIQKEKSKVISPYDGVISHKYVEKGDFLTPGTPLFSMYSKDPMLFEMNISESIIKHLSLGDTVVVYLEKGNVQTESVITEITPFGNINSHTYTVKSQLPTALAVLPGEYGKVKIPYGKRLSILIPKEALTQVGQLNTLLVNDQGRWVRRYVRIGKTIDGQVEIVSGLEGGETVGYEE